MSSYEILFTVTAFVLGSCIGSFLNVCIYRMPRGLKVNEPARSFCPSCKYAIPFYNNIPLFTWLVLRGKCANCGSRISFRYFGVELLTGLLFLAVWLHVWPHHWLHAFPYWILVALFVVATFIDFEHYIIPDEITWGGAAAGVLLSLAIPTLHGTHSPLAGAMWSVIGGGSGYVLVWGIVEAGKKLFGKKAFAQKEPCAFSWKRRTVKTDRGEESDADLVVGDTSWKSAPKLSLEQSIARQLKRLLALLRLRKLHEPERGESWEWSDTFSRESDVLTMNCRSANVDGNDFAEVTLSFTYEKLKIGDRTWELEKVDLITGVVASLVAPREAMGFGDVKFMACIGAFLGWKAVLFTVAAGSTFGAVVGVLAIVVGRREWTAKIPFGPYLALGALVWLFRGPALLAWYFSLMEP